MNITKTGQSLLIFAFTVCAVLHFATFRFDMPFQWILAPFIAIALAILSSRADSHGVGFFLPSTLIRTTGFLLFGYAVLLFIYEYKTTGGANNFRSINGQCVSMNKSTIIRILSNAECRHLPTLWMRVMSAWMGMISCFGLSQSDDVSAKIAR